MHVAERASPRAGSWFVQADQDSASPRSRKLARTRQVEERATSARAVIASSLFLVILAAALLVGGHAAIDPLLRSAIAARDAKTMGDVLYTMPDGVFCRHMSFDNTTAEVVEGAVERCPGDIAADHSRSARGFAWGAQ